MKRLLFPLLVLLLAASTSRADGHFFPKGNPENAAELVCPPPTGLSTINITANSAKLLWAAVGDALGGYQVQMRVAGTSTWTTLSASTNYLIVQNLLAGTTYQWRVQSICSPGTNGSDFSDTATFTTLASTNCSKPVDLSTSNITSNSAQLNWNPVAGAAAYEINIRPAGSTAWTVYTTTAPPFSAQNLAPFTVYIWRVRAVCSNTTMSDWSVEKDFKTLQLATDCPKPTGLHATNITQNSAQLNWASVAGALAYQIDYQVIGTSNWTTVTTSAPATSVTVNGLTPNTGYIFRVRAKCDGQVFSEWSDLEDFKTLEQTTNDCPHPFDLVSTNITSTSVQLSWAPVTGALGYEVQYAVAGTTNWKSVFVTNGTVSTTVSGLTPNTAYIWRVRAKCDGSIFSDWSDTKEFKTLGSNTGDCTAPVDLSTTNITQTSAQVNWHPVAAALGYEVQYSLGAGAANWQSVFVSAPATSVVINNLLPNTVYIWRVRAKCDGQIFSDWSVTKEFKTLGSNTGDCTAPVGLSATNITSTSAQLSWGAVTGALAYEVNYQVFGATNWQSVFVTAPTTSVVINNLTPQTGYNWRVRAKCDGQVFSDWSSIKEFKTLGSNTGDCKAPHEFAVKDLTHHSALLAWNKVAAAQGYEVQVRKLGTTAWSTYIISGNPPNNYLFIDNLLPEMDYEWRVRSICAPGQVTDWGPTQTFMTLPEPGTGTPCPVPTDFAATQITHHSVLFTWNAAPGAFSYQITYRVAGTNVWKTINVTGNPPPTSFLLDNLAPGTTYEAKIRSHCATNSSSDWSQPITFTTLGAPPCSTPTDLQATNITFFSADLSWSAVPGATSYRVRWRRFGTQAWKTKTITGNPPATTTNVSPLPANSTIEWQVKAFCGSGSEGDWSPLASFTTLPKPPCDAPTAFTFTDIEPTSATISWTGSTGALSYRIRYRKISPNGQPGPWKVKIITGTPPATTTSVDGLEPESVYEVQGRTLCGPASQSVWSVTATFMTPPQFQGPGGNHDFLKQKQPWTAAALAPNPTGSETTLRFQSSEEDEASLQIIDVNGRAVFATQVVVNEGLNEIELSLGNLSTGIYVVRLQGATAVLTERVKVAR